MLRKHWFLAAYLAVLAGAWAWPWAAATGGPLGIEILKPWCIAGIFLCAGLTLPSRRLGAAAGDWHAHAVIQAHAFVIAPLLGLALAWLAGSLGQPIAVQAGLIVLGCLPTTIGSCVAITGLAGGNQGIALVGSVSGNLLGIILTPLLAFALLQRDGTVPLATVVGQLALLAAAPVLLGQLVRRRWEARLDRQKPLIGGISAGLLLVVLLGIFSDLFHRDLGAETWPVAGLCLALHLALLAAAWASARGRLRPDRLAIAITASHKTAALGIPLISLLFAGDPALAQILLPIALYHIVQLCVGSLLSSRR